jgi:hypothetical protein
VTSYNTFTFHFPFTLINSNAVIEYETNIATGTVNPQKIKIFFTVVKFIEFSSLTSYFSPASFSTPIGPSSLYDSINSSSTYCEVIIGLSKLRFTYALFTISTLLQRTIPNNEPTMQWVVERGIPSLVPRMMQVAVAN